MSCEHRNASKIHTYEGVAMKIIDTNYQCSECGRIMKHDEYQNILINNCSNCNGIGEHTDGYEKYKCVCILDEE